MTYHEFKGKTAIFTGAASGMGLLCSQCYAAEGGNVLMVDVNEEALRKEANAINAKGVGKAVACVADIRKYDEVCAVRDLAVQTFGSIDLLISFAGGTAVRCCSVDRTAYPEFPDVPIDVYEWGLDVNLKGPFYFAHACLKQMREQKSGVIINIGSVTGAEGDPYGLDYPTAKSALMNGFTKSLAQYGAAYGIRVNCVSPGPVLTRAAMAKMQTPLGRAAEPQEIIDLVLYLASDKAAFITGANYMIDGGRSIMKK